MFLGGEAGLHGRFAHADLPSILNANIRRTRIRTADETRFLGQRAGAWTRLGADPSSPHIQERSR